MKNKRQGPQFRPDDEFNWNKVLKVVLSWSAIILMVFLVMTLFKSAEGTEQEISYTEYRALMQENAIVRATIRKSELTNYDFHGELREARTVRTGNKESRFQKFVVTLPVLDSEVVKEWNDRGIQFTIQKVHDTYINRYAADTNYVDEQLVWVGWKQQFAGLFHFPVKLPATAIVDSASLQVYAVGWSGVNLKVGAYGVLREWMAEEATWTNATSLVPWGAPGCNDIVTDRGERPEFAVGTDGPRRWYSFDITGLARQWVSGGLANNGVLLKAPGDYVATYLFGSAENGDPSARPRLVIRWH